jgi:hypothetical protein
MAQGQMARKGCIVNAREGPDAVKQIAIEKLAQSFGVTEGREIKRSGYGVMRIKARIDRTRVQQAAKTESRSGEKDHTGGHLSDD